MIIDLWTDIRCGHSIPRRSRDLIDEAGHRTGTSYFGNMHKLQIVQCANSEKTNMILHQYAHSIPLTSRLN